jgi:hypothetical protein
MFKSLIHLGLLLIRSVFAQFAGTVGPRWVPDGRRCLVVEPPTWTGWAMSGPGGRRAFPGEASADAVVNDKLPSGWLTVEDQWSLALPLTPELQNALSPAYGHIGHFAALLVRWFERIVGYRIRCTQRGFTPRPARGVLEISGSFAWSGSKNTWIGGGLSPVLPLEQLGFPPKTVWRTKVSWRAGGPRSNGEIRDYHAEDSFAHPLEGHGAGRIFRSGCERPPATICDFLNVATLPKHWQDQPLLLGQATVCVDRPTRRRGPVHRRPGCGGSIPHDQQIGSSRAAGPTNWRASGALAAVTSFATASIKALLLAESPRLPGRNLVVVTAVVTDELAAGLVRLRRLAPAGARLARGRAGPLACFRPWHADLSSARESAPL